MRFADWACTSPIALGRFQVRLVCGLEYSLRPAFLNCCGVLLRCGYTHNPVTEGVPRFWLSNAEGTMMYLQVRLVCALEYFLTILTWTRRRGFRELGRKFPAVGFLKSGMFTKGLKGCRREEQTWLGRNMWYLKWIVGGWRAKAGQQDEEWDYLLWCNVDRDIRVWMGCTIWAKYNKLPRRTLISLEIKWAQRTASAADGWSGLEACDVIKVEAAVLLMIWYVIGNSA